MEYILVCTLLSCIGLAFTDIRVVDLTYVHVHSSIVWPGNPKYNFTVISRNRTNVGYWFEANSFATAEHGGTHVDSPSHFAEGSWRTQHIPIEKLFGPGVIIDVKAKAKMNPDYRVTTEDLIDWERKYGTIPRKSVVIMNSGWGYHYPNKNLVFNSSTPDDPNTFHFPSWHENAVTWLINRRHINMLGVDTPSNDYGQSKTFAVHIILSKANIAGIENVAFLDQIPPNGTMIYAAVMKLQDGSRGPARVFATITEKENREPNKSITYQFSCFNIIFMLFIATIS